MKTLLMSERKTLRTGPCLAQGLGLAVMIAAADQATKWLVVEKILKAAALEGRQTVSLLPGLNFTMVWNKGVSFGLFDSGDPRAAWFFSALAVVICLPLLGWLAAT